MHPKQWRAEYGEEYQALLAAATGPTPSPSSRSAETGGAGQLAVWRLLATRLPSKRRRVLQGATMADPTPDSPSPAAAGAAPPLPPVSASWPRRAVRLIGRALLVVLAAYLVVRAAVEPFVISPFHPESHRHDWGGPHYLGVILVHCGPGLLIVLLLLRRRLLRALRGQVKLRTAGPDRCEVDGGRWRPALPAAANWPVA